jgi:hypothetical protein
MTDKDKKSPPPPPPPPERRDRDGKFIDHRHKDVVEKAERPNPWPPPPESGRK